MSKDERDKLPVVPDSDELTIIDESNSISDYTHRPLQGANRKRAEQYLEDLKKYRPQEYEELMKSKQAGS